MMILGTGVGTSAVCNGRVERGVHGTAGILGGHFPIAFENGRTCNCGGEGCVEAYVGTWALGEMAGDPSYDYRRFRYSLIDTPYWRLKALARCWTFAKAHCSAICTSG